jgi:hypothetical protein
MDSTKGKYHILCKSRKIATETLAMIGEPRTGSLDSQRPKEARQVKSKVKSMLIIFFHIKSIIHKEFVLADQTANSAYYCDVYGDCFRMCEDFAPNFGDKRTGHYMTTHGLTLPLSLGNF